MTDIIEEGDIGLRRVVGANWGLSITVVVIIIAGVIFNLKLFSELGERNARIETTLVSLTQSVNEIKNDIKGIDTAVNASILQLRRENADMRERLAKIEARVDTLSNKE